MNPLALFAAVFFMATGHFWLFVTIIILICAGAFDDE